jgi:hypothetical protein
MDIRLWLVLLATLMHGTSPHARAEFHFAKTTVNLGKVKSGVTLSQEFAFEVRGSEPVEIVEVRPGCGCVQSDLKQKSLGPGEKGTLALKVNTLGEAAGAHRWYLYVFYRQGEQKGQLVLQILAEVETEVNVQPGRLSIHAAGPITHELLLTDVRAQHLTISDVRATPTGLRAIADKPFRDSQGRWNVKIKVTAGADLPEGRSEGMVSIYTDDVEYRHLQIPVTVTRPAVQRHHANPAEVKLYGEVGGPLPARLVLIRDGRDEPVEIEQIKCNHRAVQCKWARGPGKLGFRLMRGKSRTGN